VGGLCEVRTSPSSALNRTLRRAARGAAHRHAQQCQAQQCHATRDRVARLCGGGGAVTLTRMRLTEFWERMRAQFGEVYAESVAKDYVLSALGNRTVDQALAEGTDAKTVWRAVCEAFKVPERQR
jgi:hypothetical protein